MKKEKRTAVYDDKLKIEAFMFEGIFQPFPNHFHEYYVLGFIENGKRCLSCKNKEYIIRKGDIVLFNPGDNHTCSQIDEEVLDYRGLNISKNVMQQLAEEVTGSSIEPYFSENVIADEETAYCLYSLHDMIMKGSNEFGREECLFMLIGNLIQKYSKAFNDDIPECREEIEKACEFMQRHFDDHITLDEICGYSGLSKSTLLRAFIKIKGITPYRYLENIRIDKAKKLLEQGGLPVEAAMKTGFFDQSHFTNYFSRFIGLSPGAYREIFLTKNHCREADNEK